jgi:hypothetical protein
MTVKDLSNYKYLAIYSADGVVESIIGLPADQVDGYSTGNEMLFEVLDFYEQAKTLELVKGKISRRVGPKQYEVQDK